VHPNAGGKLGYIATAIFGLSMRQNYDKLLWVLIMSIEQVFSKLAVVNVLMLADI
jgi:hypothetical protein